MRILRPRYALSLLAAALALLAGGALDWLLEWAHNQLLSSPLSSSDLGSSSSGEGSNALLRPQPRPIDAVVVLGYALARDGSPSQALEHRVRGAVREWERACRKEGKKEEGIKLVFSGGHPGGGVRSRSEAAVMWGLASELLLPPISEELKTAKWILEEKSTSTWENAVESLELLSRSFLFSPSFSSKKGEGKGGVAARRKAAPPTCPPLRLQRDLALPPAEGAGDVPVRCCCCCRAAKGEGEGERGGGAGGCLLFVLCRGVAEASSAGAAGKS